MNKNTIIITMLAMSLLLNQPTTAQQESKRAFVNRLKKEYKEFRDAFQCAHQKGFRRCSREQKERIVVAGITLLAVMATIGYGIVRTTHQQQVDKELLSRIQLSEQETRQQKQTAQATFEKLVEKLQKEIQALEQKQSMTRNDRQQLAQKKQQLGPTQERLHAFQNYFEQTEKAWKAYLDATPENKQQAWETYNNTNMAAIRKFIFTSQR